MKATIVHPDGLIEVMDCPKPRPNRGEILLRTLGCGVCGTDVLKINLKLVKQPTVLGHELVGEIVEIGDGVASWSLGDRVVVAHHVPCFECHYCRHGQHSMCARFKSTNFEPGGFAEFVRIPTEHLAHTAFKIAPDMDWREAMFTEPLACCVRNVERLPLLRGDVVVIVGLGSIGLMMASLLKRAGIQVIGIDLDGERCTLSTSFGVTRAFSATAEVFLQTVLAMTEKRNADGIIFTAGPSSLLNTSMSWIRDGGVLNIFSHLSGDVMPVDVAAVYHRELQIISTYSSSPETLRTAFEILSSENLQLSRMVSGQYGLTDLARAVDDINQRRTLKAVLVP